MTKKLKLRFLGSLPTLAVLVLVLLFVAPKHVYLLSAVMPLLQLVPVFIWAVMHPRDMSLWALAAIGLFVDVATGLPLALSALCYCLFFLLVRSQRKYIYKEGFAAMWGYFALLLLVMQCAGWGMVAFYQQAFPPIGSAVLQWFLTVMLYPPLHRFFYPWVEKIAHARYQLLHG